jgi:hypothetical protein
MAPRLVDARMTGSFRSMPTTPAIIGYLASGLVLATFWTNDLRHLRILAILSNIAFISYGTLVWLPPVLGLHLLLLPLNAVRLMGMGKCTDAVNARQAPGAGPARSRRHGQINRTRSTHNATGSALHA